MDEQNQQRETPAEMVEPEAEVVEVTSSPVPSHVPVVMDAKGDADVEAEMRRMSRRSFLWAAVAGAGVLGGFKWMNSRRLDEGIVWPLRRALDFNGEVTRDLFSSKRLAMTYPASRIEKLRVNGEIGMSEGFDPATWTLNVSGLASGEDLMLPLSAIQSLPQVEIITELKCIEGWSTIVRWGGARLSDFIAKYPPATQSGGKPDVKGNPADLVPYVSLVTPDGGYYVGLDMESALHPQTLLCTHMNGKPLTLEHGAPLRLVTPVKYGIKNLKRIGTLAFTAQRPADYWAERGYDWYAGH